MSLWSISERKRNEKISKNDDGYKEMNGEIKNIKAVWNLKDIFDTPKGCENFLVWYGEDKFHQWSCPKIPGTWDTFESFLKDVDDIGRWTDWDEWMSPELKDICNSIMRTTFKLTPIYSAETLLTQENNSSICRCPSIQLLGTGHSRDCIDYKERKMWY
jgi:hypothetical protein